MDRNKLTTELHEFLKTAFATPDGMAKLINHYRMTAGKSYSFANSILIMCQGGTVCDSFQGWKNGGRYVKKGEKGKIFIRRPMTTRIKDDDGETRYIPIPGKFHWVTTFDIAQTDGKPIEYKHNEITPAPFEDYKKRLSVLCPIVEETTGTARGYTDYNKIAVSVQSSDHDKTKTLFHEAAHFLLHKGSNQSKAEKECEAEATAFLCMKGLGLESELSKEYFASYREQAKNIRLEKILSTAEKILKIAA